MYLSCRSYFLALSLCSEDGVPGFSMAVELGQVDDWDSSGKFGARGRSRKRRCLRPPARLAVLISAI